MLILHYNLETDVYKAVGLIESDEMTTEEVPATEMNQKNTF
jgi:hypothetical protein